MFEYGSLKLNATLKKSGEEKTEDGKAIKSADWSVCRFFHHRKKIIWKEKSDHHVSKLPQKKGFDEHVDLSSPLEVRLLVKSNGAAIKTGKSSATCENEGERWCC